MSQTMAAFGRHCAEIVAQADLFADHLDGADVSVAVPSCPGWNVSQLARHVDGGLRWDTGDHWVMDFTGGAITWRRSDETTKAGLQGSVA